MQERFIESILEVKDLKKNYGDYAAVKGITFDIKAGEIFSLLAPNGAGKTILYKTHYMEEAEELSNRFGIIDHGELIALGTQDELTQQVGQTDTLILHIGENEDTEALAESLKSLDGVLDAIAVDHEISMVTPQAEDVLATVVGAAKGLTFPQNQPSI